MPRLLQETLKPLIEYKKWRGIDNLATDDMRVHPGFVRSADNVDIDSEGMMHMRQGVLQSLLSGDSHSLWSDEGDLCFFVKDNNLLQITSIYKSGAVWMASYSTLLAGVGPTRMNFVPVGHKTFFSNLVMNGYIEDGVAYGFPEVDKSIPKNSFKTRMPGGDLIEYFNGRIYIAQNEGMYFSDAYNPGVMDERKNFYTLGGGATMMLAVKDGLYISAGSKVFFALYKGEVEFPIEGGKLKIPDFDYKLLLDVPAINGSAVAIERYAIKDKVIGRCVIFSTSLGIFIGLPEGYLKDMTSDNYAVYDIEEGAAMVKWHNGYRQYVFLGQMPAEVNETVGAITFPALESDGAELIS